jgi:hypothetical protein
MSTVFDPRWLAELPPGADAIFAATEIQRHEAPPAWPGALELLPPAIRAGAEVHLRTIAARMRAQRMALRRRDALTAGALAEVEVRKVERRLERAERRKGWPP